VQGTACDMAKGSTTVARRTAKYQSKVRKAAVV